MKLEIAAEDIVQENALGQSVVVVPAGQPIPEGLDISAKTVAADQNATEDTADAADAPAEKAAARNRKSKA